jgi:hypothetical protein
MASRFDLNASLPGWMTRVGVPSVPLVLLVVLPKCPICLGAYLGLFAFLGWSSGGIATGANVFLVGCGGFFLVHWARVAHRRRRWFPWVLGVAGFAAVLGVRFLDGPSWLSWAGVMVFAAGVAVTLRSRDGLPVCCSKATVVSVPCRADSPAGLNPFSPKSKL